jgi:hypothetical protein
MAFEFKVRPVTRYVITMHDTTPVPAGSQRAVGGSEKYGEFENVHVANDVCGALATAACTKPQPLTPEEQVKEIPRMLREIAGDLESGVLNAATGVLTLRAPGASRPAVYGFGHPLDPHQELEKAAREVDALAS